MEDRVVRQGGKSHEGDASVKFGRVATQAWNDRKRFECDLNFEYTRRICICKHRCIPRQRYDLRVRAIIPPIQPVSRLFDETIPPESSLLNERKKKKKKKKNRFPPRCHAPLSHNPRVTVDFWFGAQPAFSTPPPPSSSFRCHHEFSKGFIIARTSLIVRSPIPIDIEIRSETSFRNYYLLSVNDG